MVPLAPRRCSCLHREGDLNQLRAEIHEVLGNRNVADEKFQGLVLEELAGLKAGLGQVRRFAHGKGRGVGGAGAAGGCGALAQIVQVVCA